MWWAAVWLAGLGWLAGWEVVALFNKRDGDTLSEHVWRWFHVFDARPTWLIVLGRGFLALGGIWLAGHFAFGWWTPTHPWPGM